MTPYPASPTAVLALVIVIAAVVAPVRAAGDSIPPLELPSVVFDGFGFGDFKGAGSIAGALRRATPASTAPALPLDIVVRGPTGRDVAAERIATEIRSRIESLDLSAGVVATPDVIHEGLATWIGGMSLESDHEAGREVLELKTSLSQAQQTGVFGIEVGPRIERRLRRGAVLFLDGKAEARAMRSVDTGGWTLPGASADSTVGVAARTGLTR